jgi:hypothetical protein
MVAADNNRLIVSWKLLCILFTLMEMMKEKCSLSIRWTTMYTSWPRNGLAIYLLSFLRWSVFSPCECNAKCVVTTVALKHVLHGIHQFSLSIVQPMIHIHSFVTWSRRMGPLRLQFHGDISLLHLEKKKKKYLAICVTIPLRKGNSLWYFGSTV